MSSIGAEAGHLGNNSGDADEQVIVAQGTSDIVGEGSAAQPDAYEALADHFVPGLYEIMPRIRKFPHEDGGRYESDHRSRRQNVLPDRVISGMTKSAPSPEQLDLI